MQLLLSYKTTTPTGSVNLYLHIMPAVNAYIASTARFFQSLLFGSLKLDGGQAEFVRVPLVDGTAVQAPAAIPDETLIPHGCDLPTGYYGVKSVVSLPPLLSLRDATMVVIGCCPVELCAVAAATIHEPKHLFSLDSIPSRVDRAEKLGAEPLNLKMDKEDLRSSNL